MEANTDAIASLPRFYCSSVRAGFGFFDFQLVMSTNVIDNITAPPGTAPQLIMMPQCVAHFSPEHFKQMVMLFNTQLAEYEKQFGEINNPPKESKAP